MQIPTVIRRGWFVLPLIAMGVLAIELWPSTSIRADVTFVVDTIENGAGTFACTAAADDCGLLGAIEAANVNPGPDAVVFGIPVGDCPGGVCTIELSEPVEIFDAVTVDATTQPRGSGPQANVCATGTDPSRMRVELRNSAFIVDHPDGGTIIRGFGIGNTAVAAGNGSIQVLSGSGHQISCNHIGLDAAGTANTAHTLEYGVFVESASDIVVGTDGDGSNDAGEGNRFGAALDSALYLLDSSGNLIAGNVFGAASEPGGTSDEAVLSIYDSTGNLIGSDQNGVSDVHERNYFTSKVAISMTVESGSIAGNTVVGNTFSMSPSGDPVPGEWGIFILEPLVTDTGIEIRDNLFGPVGTGALVSGEAPVVVSGNTFGREDGVNLLSLWLVGAGPYTVQDNQFHSAGDVALVIEDVAELADSAGNCFMGNTVAVENATGVNVTLENNWWGAADGPSGEGPGSGDPVGPGVDFVPWMDDPPEPCNAAPVVADGEFTIAEDASIGTAVGTVEASDDGSSPPLYAITGGDPGGVYAINAVTGELSVAAALDHETTAEYALTVTAADEFASGSGSVTVTVTDVDERPPPAFDDMPREHTFFADVEWLAEQAITRGCNPPDNDLFCPDDVVTRGQMAAFMHRALDEVLVPGTSAGFIDTVGSIFEADVEWLGVTGITRGCNPPTNDLYCPDDVVTRGQMAAFLVRALGYTEGAGSNAFVDDDASIFQADIERLAEAGVTRGCNPPTNDLFCPGDPVTRSQMAAFLHRALG
jgi:hypothetical protein